ncbi:MAG: (2Fe-2S)-binding protein [Paracoccaceae bacterium]
MVELRINGETRTVEAEPDKPLLWVLRDDLRLTGTKFGCGIAQCGACTVLVDGLAQRACVTPVSAVEGASITTIEGLDGPEAEAVRTAWVAIDVPQCGYCQSGQVVAATALLRENARPDDAAIDAAMAGNLCRCATYVRVRRAIHDASDLMEG